MLFRVAWMIDQGPKEACNGQVGEETIIYHALGLRIRLP